MVGTLKSVFGATANQGVSVFETGGGWTVEASEEPATEKQVQLNFVREIFGNPFRPVVVDPSWLAWNDGTVVKLAQDISEDEVMGR